MLKQKEIIEASKQQMEQTGSFVEAPAKPDKKKKPPVQFVAEVKSESQG